MDPDPVRVQSVSIAFGALMAAVAVAGCAALAWLSPQPGLGDAKIVMDRASGALYVRVGDTVHPVLNLTSARLIAQAGDDPHPVDQAALNAAKRGPQLGIPGAPGADRATAVRGRIDLDGLRRCRDDRHRRTVGRRGRHPCASR